MRVATSQTLLEMQALRDPDVRQDLTKSTSRMVRRVLQSLHLVHHDRLA
jgi:hypothetical protein